jgi:hypothetical protein
VRRPHAGVSALLDGVAELAAEQGRFDPDDRERQLGDLLDVLDRARACYRAVARLTMLAGCRVRWFARRWVATRVDGLPAARVTPALTTVRQDVVQKGTIAAAELVAAVRGRRAGNAPPVHHHVLPAGLVVRETTAPPVDAVHATFGAFVG